MENTYLIIGEFVVFSAFFVAAVGAFLPVLPGPLLSFAAVLGFKLVFPESPLGWVNIAICGFLAFFAQVADFLLSWFGAKKFGATWRGGVGAFVGVVVGIFLPPPLIGAFVAEYLGGADARTSGKAGLGAFLGTLLASMLKFLIVVYMAAAFALEVFGLV